MMKDNQAKALSMILKSCNRGVTVRQLFNAGINDVYGTIKNLRKKGYPIVGEMEENLKIGVRWINYFIPKSYR